MSSRDALELGLWLSSGEALRVLEEAGIAYAFEDDGEASRLVLADMLHLSAPRRCAPIAHVDAPMDGRGGAWVTEVTMERRACAGAVALRDHDFLRPRWTLLGEARSEAGVDACSERYRFQPGACLVDAGRGAARNVRTRPVRLPAQES